jgi:hypothetical protein
MSAYFLKKKKKLNLVMQPKFLEKQKQAKLKTSGWK